MLIKKPGAGRRDRTDILSLEGCCTTIVLYPRGDCGSSLERRSRFLSVVLIRRIRQGAWWGKKDSNLRSLRRGFTVPPLCHSGHSPSAPCRTVGPLVSAINKRDETKAFGLSPPLG